MLLVTGGAGFIGSNLVASLNEAGRTDIVVNDAFGGAGKWRNLGKRQLADVVPPEELISWLDRRKISSSPPISASRSSCWIGARRRVRRSFMPHLRRPMAMAPRASMMSGRRRRCSG
jgi:ADP-L-glycero-D-manno-heptose 6-epimerase